jgi:acyl carrier protein
VSRDEILARVRDILVRSFQIEPGNVKPETLLFQDLGLDSIDAIDMVVYLQEWTGRRVPEEALRKVRTVDDVVSLVEAHLAAGGGKDAPPAKAKGSPGGAGGTSG